MTILINVSGYNELQVKFQPWWSRHSPGSPSGVMVPKIHLQSTQTSPRWGILNWPEFIWGLFPFCFMDVMCHFLASEICTSKNLRYSQTFNTPGIMSSCIFSVHWSSITPSTEKAPWDCVHLKVLYELPSHKDSGNQKSSSEFVLCEWVGSRNQPVSTYVSSSVSWDGVSHPQEIWGGLESLWSQTQPLIVVLIWKTFGKKCLGQST